jgi:hypothetical protein
MRPFAFVSGLAIGVAVAMSAPLASPDPRPLAQAHSVAAAFHAPSAAQAARDPYAALWHCREEVRSFLAVRTESHARRLKALEDCVAAAERAQVEVAGP